MTGIRRSGKSTLLGQICKKYYGDDIYYFSFEDERLLKFSVDDFNLLYELFLEIYGERKIFFLDEIQNTPNWESFVRRMQDKGYKFYLTGSNAILLSKELATRLTGRNVRFELYPFSFKEFLSFNNHSLEGDFKHDTKKRAKLKKLFNSYLQYGGMPEYLQYGDLKLLKYVYEDILYRDIVVRYNLQDVRALRDLTLFLISNIGSLFSYNKLKSLLQLGSVNTVKNYISYLEYSYLVFTVSLYSTSLKKQAIANKKLYVIDNGIIEAVAFQFSKNSGSYLENLVFMALKRQGNEIYYYKTKSNFEVDFLIKKGRQVELIIQVSDNIDEDSTKDREIRSLIQAMEELNLSESFLLTMDREEKLEHNGKIIHIVPVYQWLLG